MIPDVLARDPGEIDRLLTVRTKTCEQSSDVF